jgi:hypothetical protein
MSQADLSAGTLRPRPGRWRYFILLFQISHFMTEINQRQSLHFLLANGFFAGWSNDEAQEMSKSTASCRNRGFSRDQVWQEIQELLATRLISLDAVRELGNEASESFRGLYSTSMEFRRKIRRSSMNRLIPSE